MEVVDSSKSKLGVNHWSNAAEIEYCTKDGLLKDCASGVFTPEMDFTLICVTAEIIGSRDNPVIMLKAHLLTNDREYRYIKFPVSHLEGGFLPDDVSTGDEVKIRFTLNKSKRSKRNFNLCIEYNYRNDFSEGYALSFLEKEKKYLNVGYFIQTTRREYNVELMKTFIFKKVTYNCYEAKECLSKSTVDTLHSMFTFGYLPGNQKYFDYGHVLEDVIAGEIPREKSIKSLTSNELEDIQAAKNKLSDDMKKYISSAKYQTEHYASVEIEGKAYKFKCKTDFETGKSVLDCKALKVDTDKIEKYIKHFNYASQAYLYQEMTGKRFALLVWSKTQKEWKGYYFSPDEIKDGEEKIKSKIKELAPILSSFELKP